MSKKFSKAVNQFSFDIYQQCVADTSSNVILSPLSIQTALSLLLMGAKGKTAEEMILAMKYDAISRDDVANHYKKLMKSISNSSCVKLASKVFVQQQYKFKKEFQDIAIKKFHSEAENVDFSQTANTSRHINKWVEAKTNDKIKDLMKPDIIDSMTRIILVNAIHFKGSWKHQFNKDFTGKSPFWISETTRIRTDMMYQYNKFKYGVFKELNARAIELEYQNSDFSMLIVLPKERFGLKKLEEQLKNLNIADLTKNMSMKDVELILPRFQIEFEVKLKDILEKMGMGSMFSDDADLSDLLEKPEQLRVNDIIHKAFIEVNEEGAESAASTRMLERKRALGGPTPPPRFEAEHPFIYFIKNSSDIPFLTGCLITMM